MNQRLYYTDAYVARFTAVILERLEYEGRPAIVLDRTAFYPTSGGQPHDAGILRQGKREATVVEVAVRDEDEAVIHILNQALPLGEVTGEIDWPRRFDHMQQHTGQHILSQAFIRVAGAETIGFHLSPQTVTIDLDRQVSPDESLAAERLANEIVWQNRPIRARQVPADEAQMLSLRKIPPGRDRKLRLIEIEDFDLTACGGTHVAASGAVGLIKTLKLEKRGDETRIVFCCGGRALDDYRRKDDVVRQLSAMLTTGAEEVVTSVGRLQDDLKTLHSQYKRRQTELIRLEAERLILQSVDEGRFRLVRTVFEEREAEELRTLANQLTQTERTIALLGLAGERSQLVFGRSTDAPGAMGEIIKPALAVLGQAKGGGGPIFAQGGGPPAGRDVVEKAVDVALALLRQQEESVK